MIEKLRRHWQTLTITILLLLVLSPSPIAQPFLHPLQTAQASLKAGNLEIAIEQLEYAIKFEKALAGLHLKVAELALDMNDIDIANVHLDALEVHYLQSHEAYCLRQRVNIRAGEIAGLDNAWQGLIIDCPESIPDIEQLALHRLAANDLDDALPIFVALAKTTSLNPETEEAYAYAKAALAPVDLCRSFMRSPREQNKHHNLPSISFLRSRVQLTNHLPLTLWHRWDKSSPVTAAGNWR